MAKKNTVGSMVEAAAQAGMVKEQEISGVGTDAQQDYDAQYLFAQSN